MVTAMVLATIVVDLGLQTMIYIKAYRKKEREGMMYENMIP